MEEGSSSPRSEDSSTNDSSETASDRGLDSVADEFMAQSDDSHYPSQLGTNLVDLVQEKGLSLQTLEELNRTQQPSFGQDYNCDWRMSEQYPLIYSHDRGKSAPPNFSTPSSNNFPRIPTHDLPKIIVTEPDPQNDQDILHSNYWYSMENEVDSRSASYTDDNAMAPTLAITEAWPTGQTRGECHSGGYGSFGPFNYVIAIRDQSNI